MSRLDLCVGSSKNAARGVDLRAPEIWDRHGSGTGMDLGQAWIRDRHGSGTGMNLGQAWIILTECPSTAPQANTQIDPSTFSVALHTNHGHP